MILLQGKKFNMLTAVNRVGTKHGYALWMCICDCGNTREVKSCELINGRTKSCGCTNNSITHGMSKTNEYRVWLAMINRCYRPSVKSYVNYGGRGISVCERWKFSFENFLSDMGRRPGDNYSIERIDNNGDYSPDNCKWATREEQVKNKRNSRIIELNGVSKSLAEWAREIGIRPSAIIHRINSGWSTEDALETKKPIRPNSKLSDEQVSKIKSMLADGEKSMRSIAEEFAVCHKTIMNIKRGKIFSDVTAGL